MAVYYMIAVRGMRYGAFGVESCYLPVGSTQNDLAGIHNALTHYYTGDVMVIGGTSIDRAREHLARLNDGRDTVALHRRDIIAGIPFDERKIRECEAILYGEPKTIEGSALDERKLKFARWLVERGKITDWPDGKPEEVQSE